ncbi:hypothetical protein SNE40_014446 [Patella caerulea]|uniref:Protein SSUH2 homolog n=1 Tax=Patella caerulea TaxID=87958 RepID=A0AAN8PQH1_PATCE
MSEKQPILGGAPAGGTGYGGGGPPAGAVPGAPPGAPATYQGQMPAADVKDDPNMKAPGPSAPPPGQLESVGGYENIGFNASALPPPSYDESERGAPPENREFKAVPTITEEEAREALLSFVAEHCCYGKKAAQEMNYTDLKSTSAFHYTLETFGEGRTTAWAYEPFIGQTIDVPQNGPAPGPWDIQAQPGALFQNGKIEIEVPHTAGVKPCHECLATGRIRCFRCQGRGRLHCHSCNGSGRESYYEDGEHRHRTCCHCDGSGRRRCYTCDGYGMITCTVCDGRASLKFYIKLTVLWTNHLEDHIVERTALPDELIRGVSGQISFEETVPRVWPIVHFPDQEVNMASKNLVTKHASSYANERILMQRHKVRIIPVTQAYYKWKDNDANYFVYGFEKKVFAPDYPQKCCWGCSIQ